MWFVCSFTGRIAAAAADADDRSDNQWESDLPTWSRNLENRGVEGLISDDEDEGEDAKEEYILSPTERPVDTSEQYNQRDDG